MSDLQDTVGGLPNICGAEHRVRGAITERPASLFREQSCIDFGTLRSAFAIALHMHQPLIPAGGHDLRTAAVISNLKHMMDHQGIGDNHNAPIFLWCYKRMGEFIPGLLHEGHNPRVMLEYSGTLLHGLRDMHAHDVLDALRAITCSPEVRRCVEWLGAPWGHPVAPSTPVQDYRRHVQAWQHHFGAMFGWDALGRVRGFSPSEMALPNHPDVAYHFVRTLREAGYTWVLVQEHTVERPEDGGGPHRHVPHRLVCTSSTGERASIVAIVKTQGSDTKLVAQMQPYYEALSIARSSLGGREVPPLVVQIADGENGGVMMNEFPAKFTDVMRQCSGSTTPAMNVTEYLEHLEASGVREADFPELQPLYQKRIWDEMKPGDGPEKLAQTIDKIRGAGGPFHMEGGSWTNNLSWVRGYDDVLTAMDRASARFAEVLDGKVVDTNEPRYRNALYHLLVSQTSCYRYWGQGTWTDYGRELCRRVEEILKHDF